MRKAIITFIFVFCCLPLFAQFSDEYTILVVNDDGYDTDGIRALARALASLGKVTIVGPRTNASGVGHGITYRTAIEYNRAEDEGNIPVYWVDALPASCVRWAIDTLYKGEKPDLVVSGINRGMNVGMGVYYSGTVAAAREATFAGVPAVAVSMDTSAENDWNGAAKLTASYCKEWLRSGEFFFININFPAKKLTTDIPVEYTYLTTSRWEQQYIERTIPRNGQPYFWIVMADRQALDEGSDQHAVEQGRISISPLQVDVTDYKMLEIFKGSNKKPNEQKSASPNDWWQR